MNGNGSSRLQKIGRMTATLILISLLLYFGFLISKWERYQRVSTGPSQTEWEESPPSGSTPPPSTTPAASAAAQSPAPVPSPTPKVKTLWVDPNLPSPLKKGINLPEDFLLTNEEETALLRIRPGAGENAGHWTFVLVSPFPSLAEEISGRELIAFWNGDGEGMYAGEPLYLSEDTLQVLSAYWGKPDPTSIVVAAQTEIFQKLWPEPETWAILPFEQLTPQWKVLTVNHQNPLAVEFDHTQYPLSIPVGLSGPQDFVADFFQKNPPLTNLDPGSMTHVVLTGVTALVRDTASLMEEKGITYPAQNIDQILRSADYTHVSNEVPFAVDCPPPGSSPKGYYFCSPDRYLELLKFIGTDIVELSGDHFGDWGTEAMQHTLDIYEREGWLTYGGGRTYRDGLQPLQINHNENRIALIGCNAKAGKKYATASDHAPGASRCNFPWMMDKIKSLTGKNYQVIATMQHDEIYQYQANYLQQRDFRALADAGAVIVSGSQAHQPQSVEFYEDAFIHYGLGNLFFDQYYLSQRVEKYKNADKAFIDWHIFYRNKHINTKLIPIQFTDNAQSRLMSASERRELLVAIFEANDW